MPPKVNSTILYIGLIPFEWDEETVKSVVCGSGNVVDVRLGFDYAGKNKGFCFVEYQTIRDAQRAIPLLNQVVVYHNNHPKKLRIESSKEGFQKGALQPSEHKPILPLNRTKLPDNVRLPQEMLMFSSTSSSSGMPMTGNRIDSPSQPHLSFANARGPMPGGPTQPMPPKLTNATKTLPQPISLPFAISDKINETLSKIPPAQLIELIANLKNMLNGPDAHRAMEIFQMSPNFAVSAAQALLLMGFIDSDVISDSMKSASTTPQPINTPGMQGTPVPATTTYNQPTYHAPPPPATVYSNPYGLPFPPGQQPQQQSQQLPSQQLQQQHPQASLPPQPPSLPQQPPISKWPNLPIETQRKLLAIPPDQAELMAQVLSLSPDQIVSLPPDKQEMVKNLRAQYL